MRSQNINPCAPVAASLPKVVAQCDPRRSLAHVKTPEQCEEQQALSRRHALILSISITQLTSTLALANPSQASTLELPAADVFAARQASIVAVCTLTGGNAVQDFEVIASGVVWDTNGHIVTAYSPVNAALRQQQNVVLAIVLEGGGVVLIPATPIAREPSLDLIVLQVDLEAREDLPLSPPPIASSGQLRVGQDLVLIGSTSQGNRALSAGVLSSTGRSIPAPNGQQIRGALQTDADVTALGLGGGLFDSAGSLVGVPTTSYTKPGAGRSSGVNFAVPSDVLLEGVPKLIEFGNLAGRR